MKADSHGLAFTYLYDNLTCAELFCLKAIIFVVTYI